MSAGKYDLYIEQGATFLRPITINPLSPFNLTGYSARAQIRRNHASADIIATLTCAIDAQPATGKLNISLTDTQTAALAATGQGSGLSAAYVWDLEIYNLSNVIRLLEGFVYVSPEVTR